MPWLVWGAILAFLGVAFGAFGAHALRDKVPSERLTVFQTGVQYQMYHALALLALGVVIVSYRPAGALATAAGWLFVVGVVLFSGSLYGLCLTGVRKLGAITPLGGLCFLAGWLMFALSVVH